MFAAVRQFAALVDKNPSVGAEGPYGYLHLDDCGDGTVNKHACKRNCSERYVVDIRAVQCLLSSAGVRARWHHADSDGIRHQVRHAHS